MENKLDIGICMCGERLSLTEDDLILIAARLNKHLETLSANHLKIIEIDNMYPNSIYLIMDILNTENKKCFTVQYVLNGRSIQLNGQCGKKFILNIDAIAKRIIDRSK